MLVRAYFDSNAEIRGMLRALFNSDFFKQARFKKVKSPAEFVAGTIRLVGTHRTPEVDLIDLGTATTVMGQQLLNPPTVEGWHTGKEWIDGGTLNERVNFATGELADASKPGIRDIIARLAAGSSVVLPGELVDRCLNLMGPMEVGDDTRTPLLKYAESKGELRFDTDQEREKSHARIARMLQLIAASLEYQFA